tara:strand:+ start:177 stop:374 length:198 start_codon:yes stop_codon:yes gene_type:complete
MKKVVVNLTYSWTIDKKQWKENKTFMEEVVKEPRIILGYDLKTTFWNLNDITYPKLKKIEVKNVD